MRPPRVFIHEGKHHVITKNRYYIIDTNMKDTNKIQEKISKHLHTYKTFNNTPKQIKQIGLGDIPPEGLTNIDIDKIMEKLGAIKYGFEGTIPIDKIDDIKPRMKPFSFIVNTDPSDKPGRHWIAIYIDPKNEKSLEIFDSFGEDPSEDKTYQDYLLTGLKNLIDKLHLPYMLKMRMNMVQQQPIFDKDGNYSTTCGYYAMKFILDRISGKSFIDASGLDDINDIIDLKSKEINKFKKKIDKLKYI